MEHSQMTSRTIVYHTTQPKILLSSPANFTRANDESELRYYQERPMTLNAWTQTTNDDFEILRTDQSKHAQQHEYEQQQHSQSELKLLEKIRILEENLRAHSEVLTQIHASSAFKNSTLSLSQAEMPQADQKQVLTQIHPSTGFKISLSQAVTQALQEEEQQTLAPSQQHQHPEYSQKPRTASPNSSTSVINHVQQGHADSSSVKYRIIAEGNGNEHGEPIEIQLAEDDGALNLNSSADSGRLEICLSDDYADIKHEIFRQQQDKQQQQHVQKSVEETTPSASFIKRRRLEKVSPEITPSNSNYMATTYVATSTPASSFSSSSNNNMQPTPNTTISRKPVVAKPKIHNHNNSLLKATQKSNNRHLKTPENQSLSQKMDTDNVMMSLGPNNTRIPAKIYDNVPWTSASIATRKLLMAIFDRKTLATHSMTGKPSPAFKDHGKPLKEMLDPMVIQDILFVVTRKCNVSEKEVRNAITTKCADENKMMKLQMNKSRMLKEVNKENIS